MIDINYKGIICALGIAALFTIMLVMMVATTGCVSTAKETAAVLLATPTPTPTPIPTTPTPKPTPIPTPAALPTILQKPIDPYLHGERYEGQWFKWERPDVVGLKDLHAGIIVYRHAWLDNYTWYNPSLGNYMRQEPTKGNRYFAVWVHQEVLGPDDPGMFPFYEDAFRLQVKDRLIEADTVHNPVCRILEFDQKYDYYNTVTAPPFGYYIKKVGWNPENGGYAALRLGEIRTGQGNAIDGYILFELPKGTMVEEVMLLGSFSRYGTAYWRFEN